MIAILGDIHNLTGQVPKQLCPEQGIGLDLSRGGSSRLPIQSFKLEMLNWKCKAFSVTIQYVLLVIRLHFSPVVSQNPRLK